MKGNKKKLAQSIIVLAVILFPYIFALWKLYQFLQAKISIEINFKSYIIAILVVALMQCIIMSFHVEENKILSILAVIGNFLIFIILLPIIIPTFLYFFIMGLMKPEDECEDQPETIS